MSPRTPAYIYSFALMGNTNLAGGLISFFRYNVPENMCKTDFFSSLNVKWKQRRRILNETKNFVSSVKCNLSTIQKNICNSIWSRLRFHRTFMIHVKICSTCVAHHHESSISTSHFLLLEFVFFFFTILRLTKNRLGPTSFSN